MVFGSLFQSVRPPNDKESLPYGKVLVSGRWTRSFTEKLLLTCLRLKTSHREEELHSLSAAAARIFPFMFVFFIGSMRKFLG